MWLSVRCFRTYDPYGDGPEYDRAILRWTPEWANQALDRLAEFSRVHAAFTDLRHMTFAPPEEHVWLCRYTELWEQFELDAQDLPETGPIQTVCLAPAVPTPPGWPSPIALTDQLVLPDHFTLETTTPPEDEPLRSFIATNVRYLAFAIGIWPSLEPGVADPVGVYYGGEVAGEPIETGVISLELLYRAANVKMV